MCMTPETTYFRTELVQLLVSRSDSRTKSAEIRHEENTPIMLQDELWMKQREKPSPNRRSRSFENWAAETEFSVFEFWGRFGSVFRKLISKIFIGFRTPLLFLLRDAHSAQCRSGIAIVCRQSICLSVRLCLSVTLMYRGHIGLVTSKVIAQIISLGLCSSEPQHRQSSPRVAPPKFGENKGVVPLLSRKPATSLKRGK